MRNPSLTYEQQHEAAHLEFLDALAEPVFSSRFRTWCGVGQYYLYRRDNSSPSGKTLITAVVATPAIDAKLAAMRICPLSPTEF